MFSLNSNESEAKGVDIQKENQSIFDNTVPKLVSIEVPLGTKKTDPLESTTKKSTKSSKTKKSKSKSKTKEGKDKKSKSTEKKHPLNKGELPGNKLLSDEEKAKLPASRKNRYGAFPDSTGNTEFDRRVENQRIKLEGKNKEPEIIKAEVSQSVSEDTLRDYDQSDDSCD